MSQKIKNPIFAHGTSAAIRSLIESGEIKYPAYLWYTDTNTYNFLDKYGQIECVGFPKLTGTLQHEIILADLPDGIYYVKGQYRIVAGYDPVFLAGSYVIAIVGNNGNRVRRITADDFEDYEIENGVIVSRSGMLTEEYLEEHHYTTEDYVDNAIAAMETSLKEDLTEYFGYVLPGMVANEIDKQIKPIDNADIEEMFEEV